MVLGLLVVTRGCFVGYCFDAYSDCLVIACVTRVLVLLVKFCLIACLMFVLYCAFVLFCLLGDFVYC